MFALAWLLPLLAAAQLSDHGYAVMQAHVAARLQFAEARRGAAEQRLHEEVRALAERLEHTERRLAQLEQRRSPDEARHAHIRVLKEAADQAAVRCTEVTDGSWFLSASGFYVCSHAGAYRAVVQLLEREAECCGGGETPPTGTR